VSSVAATAAVLLGLVLIAAGILKLADGDAWPHQAADLAVPRPLALVVPWVELVVGGALVGQIAMPLTAIAALALMVAFTVVLVLRLRAGQRPPCACFGRHGNRPLGPYHIVRNVVLVVVGVLALWA